MAKIKRLKYIYSHKYFYFFEKKIRKKKRWFFFAIFDKWRGHNLTPTPTPWVNTKCISNLGSQIGTFFFSKNDPHFFHVFERKIRLSTHYTAPYTIVSKRRSENSLQEFLSRHAVYKNFSIALWWNLNFILIPPSFPRSVFAQHKIQCVWNFDHSFLNSEKLAVQKIRVRKNHSMSNFTTPPGLLRNLSDFLRRNAKFACTKFGVRKFAKNSTKKNTETRLCFTIYCCEISILDFSKQ